ncbi:M48 family metallopeptidase [Haloimpatiens sp. FM7315]|uniref:M48 family metallopeptidase n=1 Tax=Haloimpatiens sp. FM7315 TaxID=3298609 RepID=UPI0035A3BB1E
MKKLIYNGKEIAYVLKRTKRKTIGITITEEAKVLVNAPYNLKSDYIDKLLLKKASWILDKLELMINRNRRSTVRKYKEGEEFYLLSKKYTLKIIDNKYIDLNLLNNKLCEGKYKKHRSIYIEENNLCVEIENELSIEDRVKYIEKSIKEFYLDFALDYLKKRVKVFENIMKVHPRSIRIKEVKSFWGSFSSKGNLSLNLNLIMMPEDIIDYIIVHELSHYRHMDHSREFWMEVGRFMKDYKIKRQWLKNNGYLYKF